MPAAAERFTWVDPSGASFPMDGSAGYYLTVLGEPGGGFGPAYDVQVDEVAGGSVGVVSGVIAKPRNFVVNVKFGAPSLSHDQLRQVIDDWGDRFAPDRGDGRLQCRDPEGNTRELLCRLSTGMEGDEARDRYTQQHWITQLVFVAADPMWRDTTDTVVDFTPTPTTVVFPLTYPITFAPSTLDQTLTVTNGGTKGVEAFPVWTVQGPATVSRFVNVTTGKTLTVTQALAPGDSLVIDTRPGAKTITKTLSGVSSSAAAVSSGPLWTLAPGGQTVQVVIDGAAAGTSTAQLAYRRRYRKR